MVSKCANPECSRHFHYLHEGKVFKLEFDPAGWPGHDPPSEYGAGHRVEHFWLCSSCALTMTLAVEKGKGVVALPLKMLRARHSSDFADTSFVD